MGIFGGRGPKSTGSQKNHYLRQCEKPLFVDPKAEDSSYLRVMVEIGPFIRTNSTIPNRLNILQMSIFLGLLNIQISRFYVDARLVDVLCKFIF